MHVTLSRSQREELWALEVDPPREGPESELVRQLKKGSQITCLDELEVVCRLFIDEAYDRHRKHRNIIKKIEHARAGKDWPKRGKKKQEGYPDAVQSLLDNQWTFHGGGDTYTAHAAGRLFTMLKDQGKQVKQIEAGDFFYILKK